MPKIRLDDTKLLSLRAPQSGQLDYWDPSLAGFGVRAGASGSKIFMLNVDNPRRSIGRYGIVSLSEARTEAKRLLAEANPWETQTPIHNLPCGCGAIPSGEAKVAPSEHG